MALKLIFHSDQSFQKTALLDQKVIPSLSGKRNPSISYMPSCADPRRKVFSQTETYYEKIGFAKPVFWDPAESDHPEGRAEFFSRDLIHLGSGQVGLFMQRMNMFKLKLDLEAFLSRGGVLLGVSAGAMILGPSLGLAALFGEKHKGIPLAGLGLVSFEVMPHWAEHNLRAREVAAYAKKNQSTVYALDDGEVIQVNGAKLKFFDGTGKEKSPVSFTYS